MFSKTHSSLNTAFVRFLAVPLIMALNCAMAEVAQKADITMAKMLVEKASATYINEGWNSFISMTSPSKDFVYQDLFLEVYDSEGKCKAHGSNFKQVGKKSLKLKDASGKEYVKERIELAKDNQTFLQTFKRQNPLTNLVQTREAYCQRMKDLIICGAVVKAAK